MLVAGAFPGVTLAGLKAQETCAGTLPQEKFTGELNGAGWGVTVKVREPEPPASTVSALAEEVMAKSAATMFTVAVAAPILPLASEKRNVTVVAPMGNNVLAVTFAPAI